jgi:2'-5' RNA ligase
MATGQFPATGRAVLPGDAFFLIRPTPMEAQAMRIAAMPLADEYGGRVPDEFHLTMQMARNIAPHHWGPLLGELHRKLEGCNPIRLQAIGLWRFYSQFRQSNALFWTMRNHPDLVELRRSLDEILSRYSATLSPWLLDDWKPHTLAVQNVQGESGDLDLPPEMPRPSFTANELWLSVYQPWGAFVDHPIVIFNPNKES